MLFVDHLGVPFITGHDRIVMLTSIINNLSGSIIVRKS